MASNIKAAKYHGSGKLKASPGTASSSSLQTGPRGTSPPTLFGNTGLESVMIDDLKAKMRDFNTELHHEMSMNHRLSTQCQTYSDRLASLTSQFDNYRMKADSRQEMVEDRLDMARQQLRDEKEAVVYADAAISGRIRGPITSKRPRSIQTKRSGGQQAAGGSLETREGKS